MRLNVPREGDRRPTMAFISWFRMTPTQQAEHLVLAHGYDEDYLEIPGTETEADCVDWFIRIGHGERLSLHVSDHDDYPNGGADRCLHTHDKDD